MDSAPLALHFPVS